MVVILEFKCLHFLHLAIYCDDDHGNDVQKTKKKKKVIEIGRAHV